MLAAMMAWSMAADGKVPAAAVAFVRNDLKIERYRAATADLNGDRADEIILWSQEPTMCGSGGCVLFVLTPQGRRYRVVTRMTVTRPPIRVLATSTRGWRDLGVRVAGGGITRPYEARLRFDGRSYPRNPSMPPAMPVGQVRGRTVLE